MESKLEPRTRGISPNSVKWERPEAHVSCQRTGWEREGPLWPPAGSLEEEEACHRADYRAQLPRRWGPAPPLSLFPPPAPSAGRGSSVGAHPPPPSRQEDKQGWNRTRTGQDGMSSRQSRTGGPCLLPPARKEKRGVITGSLHPPPSLPPSVPPSCTEVSSLHSQTGQFPPLSPSCLWVGLQVCSLRVSSMPPPEVASGF